MGSSFQNGLQSLLRLQVSSSAWHGTISPHIKFISIKGHHGFLSASIIIKGHSHLSEYWDAAAILVNCLYQRMCKIYWQRYSLFLSLMGFYIISQHHCSNCTASPHQVDSWDAFTSLNLCCDNKQPSGRRAFTLLVCRESQDWSTPAQALLSRLSNPVTVQYFVDIDE